MKRKSSCQSCRQRHRKCVTRSEATRCNGCDELGEECNFNPKFQFRQSRYVAKANRGKGTTTTTAAAKNSDDGRHVLGSSPKTEASKRTLTVTTPIEDSDETHASSLQETSPQTSRGNVSIPQVVPMPNDFDSHARADINARADSEAPSLQRPAGSESTYFPLSSPGADSVIARRQSILSVDPASSVRGPDTVSQSSLTQREAFLFRLWTQKIALISDAVDDARHFAVTVSRLALEHAVVLNGVLALASRFDTLTKGMKGTESDLESTFYHGRCIELLIDLLLQPAETYDATLLAAVVLSRLYEENDTETDTLTYHLEGTRTLLGNDVITRLAAEGGLAEAACWVHLRQAIYIAIVRRQHLDMPLGVYKELTAFRRSDDTSYGNRVVCLFAQVLLEFFPDHAQDGAPRHQDTWRFLQKELDMWFEAKPASFEPLYYEPPDIDVGKPFPCMWMVSTVPTVALQHYYASLIVSCLNECNSCPAGGFEGIKLRRTKEKQIASYLCTSMGLALSNRQALNAWYLPCHMLDLCGYCIRSPTERAHTIQYLETVRQEIQWKTAPVIVALNEQWAELDRYER